MSTGINPDAFLFPFAALFFMSSLDLIQSRKLKIWHFMISFFLPLIKIFGFLIILSATFSAIFFYLIKKDNNFIKEYYSIFKKNFHHRKIVYCGLVMFPKFLLIKNFIKYRQSRHVLLNMNSSKNILNLRPDKIVTMNMGFQKNNYIIKTKLFNKDFNCYGFEDYEFGFRLLESGFKIILCKPLVYHYDSRSYPSYMKKIEFLGFKSMKRLIQVNFLAAKDNNFYKLEDNFFIKYFLNFYFFKIVLIFLRRFAVFYDRHLFYSSLIYKIGIISSYLLGCFNKKMYLYEYYKIKSWYK
jgi:hypothetical protein